MSFSSIGVKFGFEDIYNLSSRLCFIFPSLVMRRASKLRSSWSNSNKYSSRSRIISNYALLVFASPGVVMGPYRLTTTQTQVLISIHRPWTAAWVDPRDLYPTRNLETSKDKILSHYRSGRVGMSSFSYAVSDFASGYCLLGPWWGRSIGPMGLNAEEMDVSESIQLK